MFGGEINLPGQWNAFDQDIKRILAVSRIVNSDIKPDLISGLGWDHGLARG